MNADQEHIHEALTEALPLEDGQLLTGWVVIWEATTGDDREAGHFYGPEGMTSWRALGLTEWAGRHTLVPGEEDE